MFTGQDVINIYLICTISFVSLISQILSMLFKKTVCIYVAITAMIHGIYGGCYCLRQMLNYNIDLRAVT